jgi:hypothetical protein
MNFRDIAPEIAAIAKQYSYKKPPDLLVQLQEWIDKAYRWIADLLASLKIHMPALADTNVVGNVMQFLIILVGGVCLFAIVFLAMKRMGQLNAQSQLARRGQSEAHRLLDAAAWRKEAQELAGQGHWKEACRAVYMSSLRYMHEASVIEFAPTRTNYEYWYALSPRSEILARSFRNLANRTELVWFGKQSASQEDYERCLSFLANAEEECNRIKQAQALVNT